MPVVYTCRIFKVLEEEVTLPNGHRSRLNWIDHNPCIAVVPRDGNGDFILIRQYRHATGGYLLEIPAGNMDRGETPELCVQRELREETGYRAGWVTKLFEGYLLPVSVYVYMHIYLAEDLEAAPLPPDADEDIAIVRVSPAEIQKLLFGGSIRDVKTALGLTLVLQR